MNRLKTAGISLVAVTLAARGYSLATTVDHEPIETANLHSSMPNTSAAAWQPNPTTNQHGCLRVEGNERGAHRSFAVVVNFQDDLVGEVDLVSDTAITGIKLNNDNAQDVWDDSAYNGQVIDPVDHKYHVSFSADLENRPDVLRVIGMSAATIDCTAVHEG